MLLFQQRCIYAMQRTQHRSKAKPPPHAKPEVFAQMSGGVCVDGQAAGSIMQDFFGGGNSNRPVQKQGFHPTALYRNDFLFAHLGPGSKTSRNLLKGQASEREPLNRKRLSSLLMACRCLMF